jgi:hypothetical protein
MTPHHSAGTGSDPPEQPTSHSANYGDAKEAEIAISEIFLCAIESAFGSEAHKQKLYRQIGGDFLFHQEERQMVKSKRDV